MDNDIRFEKKYKPILAEIEQYRRKNWENLDQLQAQLKEVAEKTRLLKSKIEKRHHNRATFEEQISNLTKENQFYEAKLEQLKPNQQLLDELILKQQQLQDKQERKQVLIRKLARYDGVEPTNEALKAKIDELKKKRLSLDVSFVA